MAEPNHEAEKTEVETEMKFADYDFTKLVTEPWEKMFDPKTDESWFKTDEPSKTLKELDMKNSVAMSYVPEGGWSTYSEVMPGEEWKRVDPLSETDKKLFEKIWKSPFDLMDIYADEMEKKYGGSLRSSKAPPGIRMLFSLAHGPQVSQGIFKIGGAGAIYAGLHGNRLARDYFQKQADPYAKLNVPWKEEPYTYSGGKKEEALKKPFETFLNNLNPDWMTESDDTVLLRSFVMPGSSTSSSVSLDSFPSQLKDSFQEFYQAPDKKFWASMSGLVKENTITRGDQQVCLNYIVQIVPVSTTKVFEWAEIDKLGLVTELLLAYKKVGKQSYAMYDHMASLNGSVPRQVAANSILVALYWMDKVEIED